MAPSNGPQHLIAAFREERRARRAAEALLRASVAESDLTVREIGTPGASGEAPFLWRVLVLIVLWSIAGAAVGAALGVLLAVTIGPGGREGLVLQVVAWTILGHLVAGMLAGYALLADRTHPEMPPDREGGHALLTVRCRQDGQRAQLVALLREQGASGIRLVGDEAVRVRRVSRES